MVFAKRCQCVNQDEAEDVQNIAAWNKRQQNTKQNEKSQACFGKLRVHR